MNVNQSQCLLNVTWKQKRNNCENRNKKTAKEGKKEQFQGGSFASKNHTSKMRRAME
jgi:hypothetical protein